MGQISPLQLAYLLIIIRGVLMLAVLPVVSATPGGRDAWLAALVATGLGLIPIWLSCRVAALLPGKDLVQICEACLGKVAGKALGVLYLGFFAIDAAVVLRQFGDFLTTASMPETPAELFLGMMALTTAYVVRRGIETLARANQLVLLPLVLFIVVGLCLGVKEMDPHRLKPLLAPGWGAVMVGALAAASLWSEVVLVTMLFPSINKPEQVLRYSVGAAVASGAWLSFTAAATVMFFSAPEAQAQVFPVYGFLRTISLGDFAERLDALFLVAWTAGSFFKLALLSNVSCRVVARIGGLRDYRCLALPMGFLGAVVALQMFEGVADLKLLNSPEILLILTVPFGVVFPLLLLLAGRLRGVGGQAR